MVGLINKEDIHDIADAIRAKLGIEDTFKPSEMADLISSIRVIPENSYQLNSIEQTSLATFDASAMPMPKLKVSVDAVQDLHGYDKPWAGGAGKNLLDRSLITQQTVNPSTRLRCNLFYIRMQIGDSYTISFSGNDIEVVFALSNMPQPPSNLGEYPTVIESSDSGWQSSGYTYTAGVDGWLTLGFRKNDNSNITPNDVINVQLELGSTATSFAPYSNICPISGWDEANVSVVGKNKLEVTATTQTISGITFTVNDDGTILVNGTATSNVYFDIGNVDLATSNYILNGSTSGGSVGSNFVLYVFVGGGNNFYDTGSGVSFTGGSDTQVRLVVYNGYTANNLLFKPMIRLATETDVTFEPYSGNTYTVEFTDGTNPLTVYGGTLDVISGELVVDRAKVTIDGTWTFGAINNGLAYYSDNVTNQLHLEDRFGQANAKMSSFKNVPYAPDIRSGNVDNAFCIGASYVNYRFIVRNSTWQSASDVQNWFANNPSDLVYELATPITYQLTPTQVNSLLGQNNVFADTGDILEGEYFKAL